ncbi:mannan-binding lectin [Bacteriovoracales bacterium]|nr:mannan-binding lectin [Bacteriovoracales bacterium]
MAKLKFIIILLFGLMLMVPDSYAQRRGRSFSQKAGPIWNGGHANRVCPRVCSRARAKWTGGWWTTRPGRMSVCQCNRNKKKYRSHRISRIKKAKFRRFCRVTKHRAWRAVNRCARYSRGSKRRLGRCFNRLKRIYGKNRRFMRHCKRQIRQITNHARRLYVRQRGYRPPRRNWKRRYCNVKYRQSIRKMRKCNRIRKRRNLAYVRKFRNCARRVARNQSRQLRRRGCYRKANHLNRSVSRRIAWRSRWVRRYSYRYKRNYCRNNGNKAVSSIYRCLRRPKFAKGCANKVERRYKRRLKRRRCRFQVRRITRFTRTVKRIAQNRLRRGPRYASRGKANKCRVTVRASRNNFKKCSRRVRAGKNKCLKMFERYYERKLKKMRCNKRLVREMRRHLRAYRGKPIRKTASFKGKGRSPRVLAACKARANKLRIKVNRCLKTRNVRKCMEGIQRKHERPMKKAGCGKEANQIGQYAEARTRSLMSKRKGSKGKFCRQHKMMAMQRVGKCASGKSSKSKRACVNRMVIKQKWFRTFKQKCRGEGDDVDDHIENKIK